MTIKFKLILIGLLFSVSACEAKTGASDSEPAGAHNDVDATQSDASRLESSLPPPAGDPATAASTDDAVFEAGKDYLELNPPVPTLDRNRIEVTEVFWYGCGHCFAFEPLLHDWVQQQNADLVFQRSPAMWDKGGVMERHARMYYTAKALGKLDTMHQKIFDAMNLKKKKFQSESEIADFFVEQGVSKEDFSKAFNSFGVTSAVRQAESRQRSYQIQGTPELIVNGKYRITGRLAGNHEGMLKVTNFLIDKERRAKTAD